MAYQTPITIKKALQRIHGRQYVLPAIQRRLVGAAPGGGRRALRRLRGDT